MAAIPQSFHLELWSFHLLVFDPDAVPPDRPQTDALPQNLRAPQVGHHLCAPLQDGCPVARLERLQGPVVPRVDRSEDHGISAMPLKRTFIPFYSVERTYTRLTDLFKEMSTYGLISEHYYMPQVGTLGASESWPYKRDDLIFVGLTSVGMNCAISHLPHLGMA